MLDITNAKECYYLNTYRHNNLVRFLYALLFFISNTCFIWVVTRISKIIVRIHRMNENRNYMFSLSEEMKVFITHTSIMFFAQCVIIIYIFKYLEGNRYNKSIIHFNLAAHLFLFLWFVYTIFKFTIKGH